MGGPLATKALVKLKSELEPGYLANAAAAAKSKIETETRIKKERMVAKIDEELTKQIAAKTDPARLHKLATAKLESEMQSTLSATVHKETVEALDNAGLTQKLVDTIRHKYWEGTLKTSRSYVITHFQKDMKAKAHKEAEGRKSKDLDDEIQEATDGMSETDAANIRTMLTKKSHDQNVKKAALQARSKLAEVTKKINDGLYAEELPKEQTKSNAMLESAVFAKTKKVAEAAIQQKINAELGRVEDAVAADTKAAKTVSRLGMVKEAVPAGSHERHIVKQ